METISITVPEQLKDRLDDYADEHDHGSRSEAARDLLEKGFNFDDVQRDRDRLERQYRQLVDRQEEHTELVEYVEQQRSLEQRREERREERASAPAWRRAKWWLLGRPPDDQDDADDVLEDAVDK